MRKFFFSCIENDALSKLIMEQRMDCCCLLRRITLCRRIIENIKSFRLPFQDIFIAYES